MNNSFRKEIWIAFLTSMLIFGVIIFGMFVSQKYPQLKKPLIMASIFIPFIGMLVFVARGIFKDLILISKSDFSDSTEIETDQPDK